MCYLSHANTFAFGLLCVLSVFAAVVSGQNGDGVDFAPTVSATCKAGHMAVKIHFNQPFYGIAHARDYRASGCMAQGNGSEWLSFDINLLAPNGAPDYCGVLINSKSEERSVPLAVRVHRTLELADDKFYVITCGKAGFKNAKNETSLVSLRVLNDIGNRVTTTINGKQYTLRADLGNPDGTHGIRVKSCFAFSKRNATVPLIDERGCSVDAVISQIKYLANGATAEATIASMFRFPESSQMNFQCDIAICKGSCVQADCYTDNSPPTDGEEGMVSASIGVFVVDPGDSPVTSEICESGIHPPWLLYLAIALGVMFLIMLLINCFLCTAMTCSCARTEVIEKDPSVVEDYDPYRSWHGSQYGSRYPSSTIHSTRSVSDNSDHYAIVQSRPGSRHSGMHRSRH